MGWDWLKRVAWWFLRKSLRRQGRCCPVGDPRCMFEGGCEEEE